MELTGIEVPARSSPNGKPCGLGQRERLRGEARFLHQILFWSIS